MQRTRQTIRISGYMGLAALAGVSVVHLPTTRPDRITIPVPLSAAIQRTLAVRSVRVTVETRTGSKIVHSVLDYIAPDSDESDPRSIDIGGKRYGGSITIGQRIYFRFPGSDRYTLSVMPKSTAQDLVTNTVFYPLQFVHEATNFSESAGRYHFQGAGVTGSITVTGGYVVAATDTHSLWIGQKVVGKQSDTYRYSSIGHVEPILPPPASAVANAA